MHAAACATALALAAAVGCRAHVVLNHRGEVVPQLFLDSPLDGAGPEQQWVAYGETPDAKSCIIATTDPTHLYLYYEKPRGEPSRR